MELVRHRVSPALAGAAVTVLLLITGCGGGDSAGEEAASGGSTEPFPGVSVSGELGEAPDVTIDSPPFTVEETSTEVLIEGDGATVERGDQASLQYLGINAATGDEFDSSWSAGGEPVTFPLEQGGLIDGFLDGLVGQTYGSRVAVAIPPDAGYGAAGNPQIEVTGDDTLLFVVDLIEAEAAPLSMAEGEEQPADESLPELKIDDDGIPTGFEAGPGTADTVDELVVSPVIVGDGPEVEAGQTVTVHYVAQLYPDGKVFDESWTGGQPAQLPLQPGGTMPGLLDGLVGQPVGSRVLLAVPSEQGFGPQGNGPVPPDADLMFVVDILAAA